MREGLAVRSEITPPEALPYKLDEEPRNTSMEPNEAISTLVSWLCPSGRVCGIPSSRILTPRAPNAEREPNPRIEIRWPRDGLYRFATNKPGTCANASSSPRVARPRRSSSRSNVLTANGILYNEIVCLVTETSIGRRTTVESCVESAAVLRWPSAAPGSARSANTMRENLMLRHASRCLSLPSDASRCNSASWYPRR